MKLDLTQILVDEENNSLAHHAGEAFCVRHAFVAALLESGRPDLAAKLVGDEVSLDANEIKTLRTAALIFRPAITDQLHEALR